MGRPVGHASEPWPGRGTEWWLEFAVELFEVVSLEPLAREGTAATCEQLRRRS